MSNIIHSALYAVMFWQLWWIKWTAIFAITGGGIIAFMNRIRILKNQKADLQRQVHERAELLEYSIEREKRAREAAIQANRSKGLLLVRINHEIRTPLNGVLGMTSLLAETELTDEQREYSETIRDCGDGLLNVVNDILLNDILDLAKVEFGKKELEQKEFFLENCIEEAFDVFAGKAADAGVELIYEIDENVPALIIGDNLRLRQVLMNLAENSIRFTRQGEVFITVHPRFTGEDNAVELTFKVRDTGAGIAPDKLRLLSDEMGGAYAQRKDRSGIGLVICRKLVALMGGAITIGSQLGKGTTVEFSIRTMAGAQVRAARPKDMVPLEGKRIAVVDDNSAFGKVLVNQLEKWKFDPVFVSAGKEALALLSSSHPGIDLLLLDVQPDRGHIDFANTLRKRYPQLPIILMAPVRYSYYKEQDALFDFVLDKPVKKHQLSNQIISAFRHVNKDGAVESHALLSADFSKEYPLRILVAEDNPTNQKLAIRVLGKLGYKPDLAQNGKEVLEVVSNKNYDIILMDVQMPEMDGMEASRMIRLCLSVQPVIVAMTANTLLGDREACLQAGMDDYISKPIDLEELVNILEKWASRVKENR